LILYVWSVGFTDYTSNMLLSSDSSLNYMLHYVYSSWLLHVTFIYVLLYVAVRTLLTKSKI